jgi:predicted hotdog family 3-hydroxylacyl-ACP dehydratase
MHLNRAWILRHIPHQGRMCLLDEVVSWDAERIRCRGATHHAPDNPLRAGGQLGIACGIEYAAQAMALHGALAAGAADQWAGAGMSGDGCLSPGAPDAGTSGAGAPGAAVPIAGYLAGVRGVEFHVLRLDELPGDLYCEAARVAGDRGTALYEFELRSAGKRLLRGRATVLLDARERLHP